MNFTYNNGRSGFYFLTGQGTVVTFSTQGANEVHPDDDTAVAPIDFVLFGKDKDTPQKIKAVGFCRYHNPHNGPVPIDCLAFTSLGPFSASFMTDGKEENIKRIE